MPHRSAGDYRNFYGRIVTAQVSIRAQLPELTDVKTPLLCGFYFGYGAVAEKLNEIASRRSRKNHTMSPLD